MLIQNPFAKIRWLRSWGRYNCVRRYVMPRAAVSPASVAVQREAEEDWG